MTDFREHHRQNATKPACPQRRKAADRFRQSVEALVRSHRGFVTLGPDDTVAELAGQCGLIETDFCNFAIKQKGRETCLVFVPNRHWHHDGYMRRFRELKALAAMTGRAVALVPEPFQPRI